jgi:lipopolysaccharide transport system ATP-binding protein
MSEPVVIQFNKVSKYFKRSSMLSFGFKNMVLHLPQHMKHLKQAKRFCALNDVSFEIRKGESVGLIGRNGSGKSTTLSLIAKVLRPSEGWVKTQGHICPLLELGAGFNFELNGAENILLNGILLGMTRRQVKEKFAQIVEFSELEDFLEQPLRTYSTGMIARLGFSIAAHLNPEILLLDEILAVGDMAFTEKCLKKMNSFREQGVTIFFVSHSPEMITSYCDRAIWLDGGQIKDMGDAKTVCVEYKKAVMG